MSASQPSLPEGHVIGVVSDPRLETLETDLRSAGFSDFTILAHDDVSDEIKARTEDSSSFQGLMEQLKNRPGAEIQFFEQYEDEARAGRHIVAVKAGSQAETERIRDVLQRNQVLDIRYLGMSSSGQSSS